jgi:hypothetical protein
LIVHDRFWFVSGEIYLKFKKKNNIGIWLLEKLIFQ